MSIDKLKEIINIENENLINSSHCISYIQFVSDKDIDYINSIKKEKRDISIDIILGDKPESSVNEYRWGYDSSCVNMIGTKLLKTQSKVYNIISYEDIYNDLLDFLNKETKLAHFGYSSVNLDMDLSIYKNGFDGVESEIIRKIITKLIMCSNIIATNGRTGQADYVICGKDTWTLFKEVEYFAKTGDPSQTGYPYQLSKMNIIYSDNIDSDKVILGRRNSIGNGICMHMDLVNNKFARYDTLAWHRQYCWFRILNI